MAKKRGKQKQGLRAASLEREHETVRLVNNALDVATVRGGAPCVPACMLLHCTNPPTPVYRRTVAPN